MRFLFEKQYVAGLLLSGIVFGIITMAISFQSGVAKKHDFTGKCDLCHAQIPAEGTSFEKAVLTLNGDIDSLCVRCHSLDKRTSHPVGVRPSKPIALERYLDNIGKLTCLTCHDIHKENHLQNNKQDAAGLLRGHAAGRAFCFTCHSNDTLGADWRHKMVVSYAHKPGKFVEDSTGSLLDKYTVECLSCHDGVISKMEAVDIRSGSFRHSIGLSHPVGVEYPLGSPKNDYVPLAALPKEISLFNGRVGCLSCHTPYGGGKSFLVKENRGSALCQSCHRK